jgi:hypothetical protein
MQPPEIVHEIQMAMKGGQEHLLGQLPWMIADAIDKQVWTTYESSLKDRQWGTFEAWVTHPLWEGLNSSLAELRFFCRREPEVLQRIEAALGEAPAFNPVEAGKKGGRGKKANRNTSGFSDDQTYAIKRLKRDRPDLAEKVVRGEVSAHAAAIEAGFRRRLVQVEPTVEGFDRAIAKHLPEYKLVLR